MTSSFVDAWKRNHEVNLYLLKQLTPKMLEARYSERTRTVASQFAHLHNVRLYHLKNRARDLLGTLTTFERGAQPKKTELRSALTASTAAMGTFLASIEEGAKIKSWNRSPATYLGYLLAHEAHHRGLVVVSLRLSGHKLHKDTQYGIWHWGKKGAL